MIALAETDAENAQVQKLPGEYLRRLLKEQWKDYRKSLRRCRSEASERTIHQLRVKSRQLLTLLKLLEAFVGKAATDPLRRRVEKRLRRLSHLRDLQVQSLHVRDQLDSFPEAKSFHKALCHDEQRLARRVTKQMHHLRAGKMDSCVIAVRKALRVKSDESDRGPGKYMNLIQAVDQTFSKIITLHARCHADDLASIHRLRVAFKRFRYMVELLQPVLPGVTRKNLKALREFHDRLGHIQDARMLVVALEEFCQRKPRQAAALRRLLAVTRRQRALLVRRFLAGPARIHQLWPPRPALAASPVHQSKPTAGKSPLDSGARWKL